MFAVGIIELLLIVVVIAVAIIPYWKLWSRSGHSGWWSLLMLVPVVNITMLWVLAFKRWPAESRGLGVVERF